MSRALVQLSALSSCTYRTFQNGQFLLLDYKWRVLIHPLTTVHPHLYGQIYCYKVKRMVDKGYLYNISVDLLKPRGVAMIHGLYVILTPVKQSGSILPNWRRVWSSVSGKGKGAARTTTTIVVSRFSVNRARCLPIF